VRFIEGPSDEKHTCTQTKIKNTLPQKSKTKTTETPIIHIVLAVLKNTITHREI
jgi:hypothetical protein